MAMICLSQYVMKQLARKMFIQVRCVCHHFIINLGITDNEDISIVVDDDAIQSMETGEPTVAADSGIV